MSTGYIVDTTGTTAGYNLIPGSTITATGMTDANIARLYNKQKSNVAQASTNTSTITIDIDLGSAYNVDCFAIIGYNFTSAAVVVLKACSASNFTSCAIDETLTLDSTIDQHIEVWTSAQAYRYWRLTISDTTNTAYPWIGELVVGEMTTFTHPVTWGLSEDETYNVLTHVTDYGVPWKYYKSKQRGFSNVEFDQRPDDEVAEFKTFINTSKGSFYPVLFVMDTDNPNVSVYGHITDTMSRTYTFYNYNTFKNFNIDEQPSAKTLIVNVS